MAIDTVELVLLLEDGATATSAGTLSLDVGGSQPALSLSKPGAQNLLIGDTGVLNPTEQPGQWTLRRTRSQQPDPAQLDDANTGWLDRSQIAGLLLRLRYQLGGN